MYSQTHIASKGCCRTVVRCGQSSYGAGKPALQAKQHAARVRPYSKRSHLPSNRVASFKVAASLSDNLTARPLKPLDDFAAEFQSVTGLERYALLLKYARASPTLSDDKRTVDNRVMGCTAQVWLTSTIDADGNMHFEGDSDSDISRGMCAVLTQAFSGMKPEDILAVPTEAVGSLGLSGAGPDMTPSRSNGAYNVLETIRKHARRHSASHSPLAEPFPSLSITATDLQPQGAFAVAQAQYLEPDPAVVAELVEVLSAKRIGVVAHFYMGPEVQGVLAAAAKQWPHIHISDSLVMADRTVTMVEGGCRSVVVLGVDFMAENVRAVLDAAGHTDTAVYRMAAEEIGCSLAEAAEDAKYEAYLQRAAATPGPNLHVVYINTSLRTKAIAHSTLPTITCTSSNVVKTVLQAAAEVPDVNIWYGPDTYMGGNLAELLQRVLVLGDEAIAELHPAHNTDTIRALIPRFNYFKEGTCIVHHLFGGEVCEAVRAEYSDAFQTAHFEVPGDMFTLAMEARERGMGTVGSTQNILDFITARVGEALARPHSERLQFVLGTETGMITSIVNAVQAQLREGRARNDEVTVEVVFPVAQDSVTQTSAADAPAAGPVADSLQIVPGPAGGEGCSASGGCASCPYMKMNSLSALMHVCAAIATPEEATRLKPYQPEAYGDVVIDGSSGTIASKGYEPILHMRGFQTSGSIPAPLKDDLQARAAK